MHYSNQSKLNHTDTLDLWLPVYSLPCPSVLLVPFAQLSFFSTPVSSSSSQLPLYSRRQAGNSEELLCDMFHDPFDIPGPRARLNATCSQARGERLTLIQLIISYYLPFASLLTIESNPEQCAARGDAEVRRGTVGGRLAGTYHSWWWLTGLVAAVAEKKRENG